MLFDPNKEILRFDDLKKLGIVNNRVTLYRWIRDEGFPPGFLLGQNTRAWTRESIQSWLASRAVKKEGRP
jgi:predicted DNA-binding transcriptional regulator AlpA